MISNQVDISRRGAFFLEIICRSLKQIIHTVHILSMDVYKIHTTVVYYSLQLCRLIFPQHIGRISPFNQRQSCADMRSLCRAGPGKNQIRRSSRPHSSVFFPPGRFADKRNQIDPFHQLSRPLAFSLHNDSRLPCTRRIHHLSGYRQHFCIPGSHIHPVSGRRCRSVLMFSVRRIAVLDAPAPSIFGVLLLLSPYPFPPFSCVRESTRSQSQDPALVFLSGDSQPSTHISKAFLPYPQG